MLLVDATMVVMCHVLFACCMLVHRSGCRCDHCMFSRIVDFEVRAMEHKLRTTQKIMERCTLGISKIYIY